MITSVASHPSREAEKGIKVFKTPLITLITPSLSPKKAASPSWEQSARGHGASSRQQLRERISVGSGGVGGRSSWAGQEGSRGEKALYDRPKC